MSYAIQHIKHILIHMLFLSYVSVQGGITESSKFNLLIRNKSVKTWCRKFRIKDQIFYFVQRCGKGMRCWCQNKKNCVQVNIISNILYNSVPRLPWLTVSKFLNINTLKIIVYCPRISKSNKIYWKFN